MPLKYWSTAAITCLYLKGNDCLPHREFLVPYEEMKIKEIKSSECGRSSNILYGLINKSYVNNDLIKFCI